MLLKVTLGAYFALVTCAEHDDYAFGNALPVPLTML